MNVNSLIENKINLPTTKKYTAIIGSNPSTTARSPILWNKVYKKKKIKVNMLALDVKKKNINKLINFLEKDKNFIGGAVAVPFKEVIFKSLKNNIQNDAKKIGAINCLYKNKLGKLVGINTDGESALFVFKKKFGKINNKNIAIIGFGGVGKAVASFFSKDAAKVTIFSRKLKDKQLCKKYKYKWLKFDKIEKNISDYDVIINCTSIGFDKNLKKTPIREKVIKQLSKKTIIFDVIYNPLITKLIRLSKKNKIKTINGSEMNIYQAVIAFMQVNSFVNKKDKENVTKIMKSAI